jgi:hypothetical protein
MSYIVVGISPGGRKLRKHGVPWSMKKECARRVRQAERLAAKRARRAL